MPWLVLKMKFLLASAVWPFFPEAASSVARRTDALYLFLVLLTVFVSVSIALLEAIYAIRYRRRDPDEIPPQPHASLRLEIAWLVIPLFIAIFIFAWGASIYFEIYRTPKQALEIYVTAKQW